MRYVSRNKKRLTAAMMTVVIFFSMGISISAGTGVRGFVERLYTTCLGRQAETSGCNYWTSQLTNLNATGNDVAASFFLSDELNNQRISSEEYVRRLYATLMNRTPSVGEVNYWAENVNAYGRRTVFNGFVGCSEWADICKSYGITNLNQAQVSAISDFVNSMYLVTLSRTPSASEKSYWTSELATGRITGVEFAYSFIFSDEMEAKNLDNAAFVGVLYRALMGREPLYYDTVYWESILEYNRRPRVLVFDFFANSSEWITRCNSLSIVPGEANYLPVSHTKDEWVAIQGLTRYITSDGTIVYGYLIDSTELNNRINGNRIAAGLRPYTIAKPTAYEYQQAIDCMNDYSMVMYRYEIPAGNELRITGTVEQIFGLFDFVDSGIYPFWYDPCDGYTIEMRTVTIVGYKYADDYSGFVYHTDFVVQTFTRVPA